MIQKQQKMTWEKRLRTSVSAVVLCCAAPCFAFAALSASGVSTNNPAPLKLTPPGSGDLPWLTAPAATTDLPHKQSATAPQKATSSKAHRTTPYEVSGQAEAHFLQLPQSPKLVLRPPNGEPSAAMHAARTVPANKTLESIVIDSVVLHPPASGLPWLAETKHAAVEKTPQKKDIVLETPPLQKTVMHAALSSPAKVHSKIALARVTSTTVALTQKPLLQPAGHSLPGIALRPPLLDEETYAKADVGVVSREPVGDDHTAWRDEKETDTAPLFSSAPIVLTPPAGTDNTMQVPTKTTLAKLDIASDERREPVANVAAATSLHLAQLQPAAGEPTELMLREPLKTDQSIQPLPKLDIPSVAVKAALPVQDADALPPAATNMTTQKPMLSPDTKGILERLPPELNHHLTENKHVKVDRGHKEGTSAKDDVKKHEAYGMKIAVKRPKTDVFRSLESAYNSLIAGDQQYAITLYKEVLDADPENTMALFGLATTYHRAGQLKMARPLYAQLLEIDPHNVEGLNNFLVLLADEAPDEALVELEKLQHSHPSFSPVYAQMSVLYEKKGDFSKAAEKMVQALAVSPENLKYQYNMAIIFDKMGDWNQATQWYQHLLEAENRGEKIPGNGNEIQQRLTFIRSNTNSAH